MGEIDLKELETTCRASVSDLLGDEPYKFYDNDSKILAVCHCDNVSPALPEDILRLSTISDPQETRVYFPGLDDRLGIYSTSYLKKYGVVMDLLLTQNEECGRSTSQFFNCKKDYNWIVGLDWMNEDILTYGRHNVEAEEGLKSVGFSFSKHSIYSDICHLDTKGKFAFNMGISYDDYHSPESFFRLEKWYSQMLKFSIFYHEFKDTSFLCNKQPRLPYGGYNL